MTIYAWVENGVIRDLVKDDPYKLFTEEVAQLYSEEVPKEAKPGDGWDGLVLTPYVKPVPVVPVPTVHPPIVTILDFRFLLTAAEQGEVRKSSKAEIVTGLVNFDDPRVTAVDLAKPYVAAWLQELVTANLLTAPRMAKILSGKFPNEV